MHMNIGYIVGGFLIFLKLVFTSQSIVLDNIAFVGLVHGLSALIIYLLTDILKYDELSTIKASHQRIIMLLM